MKKALLLFSWLFLASGLILSGVAGFYYVISPESFAPRAQIDQPAVAISSSGADLINPTAGQVNGVSTLVEYEDSRDAIIAEFLERHNSPLKPYDKYGKIFLRIADDYNLDFRLLPAIAMQESNLCKSIPAGTYNCLGFGIHERGTLGFDNYEEGFIRAAKEIKANYVDIGLTTPEQIMTKYTPSSNGSWADSVNQWMAEMRFNDRQLGRESEDDADVLEFTQPESSSEPSSEGI